LLKSSLSSDFETAKNQVYGAIREGRFYNGINAAADATGFRFWAMSKERKIWMGDTVFFDSPVILRIEAPFPFDKEIRLIQNGETIHRTNDTTVTYEAFQSGTYRVEIHLEERSPLKKGIPWIISNPIFLRKEKNE
jgi:hypothetical protein